MSAIQGAEKNLSVNVTGTTKLAITFPKPTVQSKSAVQEQIKRQAEALKHELRELRRKDINNFRSACKDKDLIYRFESEIQKEFDAQIKIIDTFCSSSILKTSK